MSGGADPISQGFKALVREATVEAVQALAADGRIVLQITPSDPFLGRLTFSTKEVAELTGISEKTLYDWRKDGRGPGFIKHGKTVLYPREALQKFFVLERVRTVDDDL